MTAKILSPQRTQRKIFVFFVPFVVQFWLRPKPRYGLAPKTRKNSKSFCHQRIKSRQLILSVGGFSSVGNFLNFEDPAQF